MNVFLGLSGVGGRLYVVDGGGEVGMKVVEEGGGATEEEEGGGLALE